MQHKKLFFPVVLIAFHDCEIQGDASGVLNLHFREYQVLSKLLWDIHKENCPVLLISLFAQE